MKGIPYGYGFHMNLKKTLTALLAGLLVGTSMTVAASALEPHGTGIKMRNWLVNDPNYQFSDAYKTSVWYENFTSLELGDNDRNNVLRVAISQLGYHEGDSVDDFHGMNTAGSENFMEYGRLLIPNWNDNSYDWCACFVNWCLNQARFDKASSEISCGNWTAELKTMKMWQDALAYGGTYIPKPADLIFFDWDETGKWPDHVGLVLYATSTHVFTIEGNTKTDNVALRSYALGEKQILGYGTPSYHEGDEPTMDFSYAGGMPKGTYVVSSDTAALTNADGNPLGDAIPLGSMVTLVQTVGSNALVYYKGVQGYLPTAVLCLLTREVTLTYDAIGGTSAPDKVFLDQAESTKVSDSVPALSGDTFLGWSTAPYNRKVYYKAGDDITVNSDTTLYAVWEKRSVTLAKQAAAQGLLPEYERPASIQNSRAILLGCLKDTKSFTDFKNLQLALSEDDTMGKALSLSVSGTDPAPYLTIPYGAICQAQQLEPVTGEKTDYVILRIKNAPSDGVSIRLSCNGQKAIEAKPSVDAAGQQYLVYDLGQAALKGEVNTLRLDWVLAETDEEAAASESTILLADIFLAETEAERDAVLKGKYVFPVQELAERETEPETETKPAPPPETETRKPNADSTEPTTQPSDKPGNEVQTKPNDSESTEKPDDSTKDTEQTTGCYAIIRTSAWIGAVLLACVPVILKKRDDRVS